MALVDRMNPVVLKELRQMVRGKGMLAALWTFLTTSVLISFCSFSNSIANKNSDGHIMFGLIFFCLFVVTNLVVPSLTFSRMANEQRTDKVDMQRSTLLSPRQFVDGKALCGYLLTLIFSGAALPFILLSYMLKGVDYLVISMCYFALIVVSLLTSYLAVAMGSLRLGINLKRGIYAITYLMPAFVMGCFFLMCALDDALASDVYSATDTLSGMELSVVLLTLLAAFATVILFLRMMAIKYLSEENSDTDRTVRVSLLSILLFWIVYVSIIAKYDCVEEIYICFCTLFTGILILFSADSVTRPTSAREYRKGSGSRPFLFGRYLFSVRGNSGIVFSGLVVLVFLVYILSSRFTLAFFHPSTRISFVTGKAFYETVCGFASTIISFFSLALLVRATWYYLFRKRFSPASLGIITFALAAVLPSVLAIVGAAGLMAGNVVSQFFEMLFAGFWSDGGFDSKELLCSAIVRFVITVVIALPMFIREGRRLKDLESPPERTGPGLK